MTHRVPQLLLERYVLGELSTQRMAESARELSRMSDQLHLLVAVFKLP